MSPGKPSESDLVPDYMSKEAFEFGISYTGLYYAARARHINVDSLAHLIAINRLKTEFEISEAEALDRLAEYVVGCVRYVDRVLARRH